MLAGRQIPNVWGSTSTGKRNWTKEDAIYSHRSHPQESSHSACGLIEATRDVRLFITYNNLVLHLLWPIATSGFFFFFQTFQSDFLYRLASYGSTLILYYSADISRYGHAHVPERRSNVVAKIRRATAYIYTGRRSLSIRCVVFCRDMIILYIWFNLIG
jgi:hypothetical protein